MNHPEESILNARLYLAQRMREVEETRKSKKVTGANLSIWDKLAVKFQALKIQPKKTRTQSPTLLESAN